ncbi:MAG: aminoacetone oxidase family FAD-binding enzyme [Flavobacteriales bacterium]|nr:aminoacetone oxidase family FAD-binding enzyme [Flavobacteriales bacterium]
MTDLDLIVVGAGAAGVFGAIRCAEVHPLAKILILEKAKRPLEKVKISGGGRCNVTHGIFDPRELSKFYPRGQRELLGPFNTFMTGDMMGWLGERGVETKIEDDGRVFPISDDSQTIIDCFMKELRDRKIELRTSSGAADIVPKDDHWEVTTSEATLTTKKLFFTAGSSPAAWKMLHGLGLPMVDQVPSLFTFNIKSAVIDGLMGLSVPSAEIKIPGTKLNDHGPLLITHWGLSGPAILKTSAWGARDLHERNYRFDVVVNWTMDQESTIDDWITDQRTRFATRSVASTVYPEIPKRLWHQMVDDAGVHVGNWADQNKRNLEHLKRNIISCTLEVNGKSTFKEEFVTAGGVELRAVNFKSMESKDFPGLYLAGEVLNIDAVTGGFNFQAAWTCSWIAGTSIANSLLD